MLGYISGVIKITILTFLSFQLINKGALKMNQINSFKKLPGVLAFKRGHVISDAWMFNQMRDGETPVEVIRHGIRGTQNVTGENTKEVSNIQITETAKLDINATGMIVRFHLAFLPLCDSLNACSGKNKQESKDIRDSIESFLERAKTSKGLSEVSCRYARNIANGRWLWRNRTVASHIRINVKKGNLNGNKKEIASFDALEMPTNHFNNYNSNETVLGEEIATQMRGDSSQSLIIEASVILCVKGAEVFPSQNYIQGKLKGFARLLYKVGHPEPADNKDIRVMGQAAIRDQKVFNAIRTIDTWYPSFSEEGFPISIEPQGANLKTQEFYRRDEPGVSSFDLFKRLNQINPDEPDGMFCIACFDRGGIYSEKTDKAEKVKAEAQIKEEEEV
jgi:CRISPR-associated protein Csy3